ncbi:MAG: hypothetical protein GY807_06850 [Gammaproteobacteria bacterium]|nr:hypothetical protein [Gammaproteobacteria bacterium]
MVKDAAWRKCEPTPLLEVHSQVMASDFSFSEKIEDELLGQISFNLDGKAKILLLAFPLVQDGWDIFSVELAGQAPRAVQGKRKKWSQLASRKRAAMEKGEKQDPDLSGVGKGNRKKRRALSDPDQKAIVLGGNRG